MDQELPWIQANKIKSQVTGVGGSLILLDHKGVKMCVLTLTLNKDHQEATVSLLCED